MKDYTNVSPNPKQPSRQNTSLELSQSLFMDESSADLENYLNCSLPETSSASAEHDLECSAINALSKNIKGKFHKRSRNSKKNKFFKSKSLEDKVPVNSSEIPVINEAMKKIFKETSYKPNLKHSPKIVKTYSNKSKEKKPMVESFGLPDEPFLSLDSQYAKEKNPIDLLIEPENNFNNSLIFGSWMQSDAPEFSEINIDEDFRRKSFSAIDHVIFSRGNVTNDVKAGFNFEDDNLVLDAPKYSNEKKKQDPFVPMKSLSLNDINLLKVNKLSPSKHNRELLFDRWSRYSSKLKNEKVPQKGTVVQRISNAPPRRKTRSNKFFFESKGHANNLLTNIKSNGVSNRNMIVEGENKKTNKEVDINISQDIDIVSPRRITRSSAQLTPDLQVFNTSNALNSSSFVSPSRKFENSVQKNNELTLNKKGRKSNSLNNSFDLPNNMTIFNNFVDNVNNGVIVSKPSENSSPFSSPRNLPMSLRLSYSSPSDNQKSLQSKTGSSKKNQKTMQKQLENQSEKSITLNDVDNSLISEATSRTGKHDVILLEEGKLSLDNGDSISPSKSKKLQVKTKPDNPQQTDLRKSNRLKLQYDLTTTHQNESIEEHSSSRNIPKPRNKVEEIELKSPKLRHDVQIEHEYVSPLPVKRVRGRPSKRKSDIPTNSGKEEPIPKLSKDTEVCKNLISDSLHRISGNTEDSGKNVESCKKENVTEQLSSIELSENMLESNPINTCIEREKEHVVASLSPVKRTRGRPSKRKSDIPSNSGNEELIPKLNKDTEVCKNLISNSLDRIAGSIEDSVKNVESCKKENVTEQLSSIELCDNMLENNPINTCIEREKEHEVASLSPAKRTRGRPSKRKSDILSNSGNEESIPNFNKDTEVCKNLISDSLDRIAGGTEDSVKNVESCKKENVTEQLSSIELSDNMLENNPTNTCIEREKEHEVASLSPVKRTRGRPPKRKSDIQKNLGNEEPIPKLNKSPENSIFDSLNIISGVSEDGGEDVESYKKNIVDQQTSIIEHDNTLEKNQINACIETEIKSSLENSMEKHDLTISSLSDDVGKVNDTFNLSMEAPIKRKRGRPKKIVASKRQETNSGNNIHTIEKIDKLNGSNNMEDTIQVNIEKLICKNRRKTKHFTKEDYEDEQNINLAEFHEDKSITKIEDKLMKAEMYESDEVVNTLASENPNLAENKISDGFPGNQSQTITRLHKKDLQKEIIQDTKLDETNAIKQNINDVRLQDLLSSNEEQYDDGRTDCDFINDKDKNAQELDCPETMSSFKKSLKTDDVSEIRETDNSKSTVPYSDFGYDINRRTSFRKILERVMEFSRSEVEMAQAKSAENPRCKSVPPKKFHVENNSPRKSASADSKLKYLKDKNNTFANINDVNLLKVKKCLDYKLNPTKNTIDKRTKSTNVMKEESIHNQEESNDPQNVKSTKNGIVSIFNNGGVTEVTKPENLIIAKHENSSNVTIVKSENNTTDQEDLEVQNLLLKGVSNGKSFERIRSQSFSGSKDIRIFKPRSKSTQGRKFKKRNKTISGTSASTEAVKKVYEFNVGDTVWAKIGNYPYWPGLVTEDPETNDFKKFRLLRSTPYYHIRFFGDKGKRAWAAYYIPYESPKDLDIRREQCPMEGHQNDYLVKANHMEKWKKAVEEAEMVKEYSLENKLKFFDEISSHKEKINTVEESQIIPSGKSKGARSKSISLTNMQETNKNRILNSTIQEDKIPMNVSSLLSSTKNVTETPAELELSTSSSRKRNSRAKYVDLSLNGSVSTELLKDSEESTKALKTSPQSNTSTSGKMNGPTKDIVFSLNGDISTKSLKYSETSIKEVNDSSIISSINDINSTKRKTRQSRKKMEYPEGDIDIALQLLEIPLTEAAVSYSQKTEPTSPEQESCKSPEQSISTGTPVSSRQTSFISPTRTRSRTSLKIEKRRLSVEFKDDDDASISSNVNVVQCSPRRLKLKRRTIEFGQNDAPVETSSKSFINDIMSTLPEYKKNLFRGITKERVCQICEKSGDVLKCRGPCNGDFHINCVENSLKQMEELTLKAQEALTAKDKVNDHNSLLDDSMDDNDQVEITTVMSWNKFSDNVVLSPINRKIPIIEQFDRKMRELMSKVESRISMESTDSSSEEIDTSMKIGVNGESNVVKNTKKSKRVFKHVTAEDAAIESTSNADSTKPMIAPIENVEQTSNADETVYKCPYCISTLLPLCFVCNSIVSKSGNTMRQRCSLQKCGKYYHLECLNVWHQTQWSFILHDKKKSEALDSFVCPRHFCHICASENLGVSMGRCPNDKLVKCLRCPATYHNSYHCVPAGTDILTSTQIVCPRHVESNKKSNTLNTIWCFVCSEGGNLICCETCPTSVHSECLQVNLLDDDTYICEDCESGRFPLYDEVVWVKCGTFRWWPAIILFPAEVPANVESKPHSNGEFVVKFFGTYDYFWVGRGRVFLYQEGDTGYLNNSKNKIDEAFSRAIKEAADVYNFKKGLRDKKHKEVNTGLKPPPYVRIKVNRPVGNVRVFEGNLSNTTPCDCDPKDKSPCGPNSNCLNRILLTECNPEICPAGERCKNQAFEKREYPQVKPYRTAGRGWGLKTLEPIKKGQFVIEYVGEIIDDEEYQRRITRMHQQKDENYYFLTIDKDRMLDAGPKGNAARFMNHSCNPNCETQKWTVNGDTRVGLFAIENIPIDTELTFNYNLECAGTEKKICRCGAPNCSGFIGLKPEDQRSSKKNSTMKLAEPEKSAETLVSSTCFLCEQSGDLRQCDHKLCLKAYHLECVQLKSWPRGNWKCPSHNCNICSKRTARICVLCNNSYCSRHSEGNIRQDESQGIICSEHDQTRKSSRKKTTVTAKLDSSSNNTLDTSKKGGSPGNSKGESSRSERYRKRTSCFESNIPKKKLKLND